MVVVETSKILTNLPEEIVGNLSKTGEELTFSLKLRGETHDFSVKFLTEGDRYKALSKDETTGEAWTGVISAKKNLRRDIREVVEDMIRSFSLEPGLLRSLIESGRSLHFSYGENAKSLQQVEVKGDITDEEIILELSIDKALRGPLALFNGMLGDRKVIRIK